MTPVYDEQTVRAVNTSSVVGAANGFPRLQKTARIAVNIP